MLILVIKLSKHYVKILIKNVMLYNATDFLIPLQIKKCPTCPFLTHHKGTISLNVGLSTQVFQIPLKGLKSLRQYLLSPDSLVLVELAKLSKIIMQWHVRVHSVEVDLFIPTCLFGHVCSRSHRGQHIHLVW